MKYFFGLVQVCELSLCTALAIDGFECLLSLGSFGEAREDDVDSCHHTI